jgi:toxin YoeB
MRISFHEDAWEDYLYWQKNDRKLLQRANALLREAVRTPCAGTGKPEPLRHALSGCWSRRITEEHRLVYRIEGDCLVVFQCRYRY